MRAWCYTRGSLETVTGDVLYKKMFLKTCKIYRKTPVPESLFLIKDLRAATLLTKRLWHRFFPVNFERLLRTPFLQNTSGWLLLVHFGTLGLSLHFYSRDKKWKCGLHLSFRSFLLANLWYNLSHSHTFFYCWRFELSRGFPCICFRCRLA